MKVRVIGAGLAGSEAAYYLANKNYEVLLYEMRPKKTTEAHKTDLFGELVCSNSLRSDALTNGVGILKQELRMLDSLILESATKNKIEAGTALAVDRTGFASYITEKIKNHKNITIINEEVTNIDLSIPTIVATGPLTSIDLYNNLKEYFSDNLYFFDAAAPIISYDSIDLNKVYFKNRYDKGEGNYINCPMTEEQFNLFYNELINGECIIPHEFDLKVFDGCMPVEIMAKRGKQTLLFGNLKPVGLENNGIRPYAVVQLRQDNSEGTLYNLVGFQTHLKFNEQKRIFRLIPGLEKAEFMRYGVMHKNIYINSPKYLKANYQSKINKNLFFAGQITGVEGYIESCASGLYSAIALDNYLKNGSDFYFPKTTMLGAMGNYISNCNNGNFQPMNANMGLLPMLMEKAKKTEKKELLGKRAITDLEEFIKCL